MSRKKKTKKSTGKPMDSQMKKKSVMAIVHFVEMLNLSNQWQDMEDAGFPPDDPEMGAVERDISRNRDKVKALMTQGVDMEAAADMLVDMDDKEVRKVKKKIKKEGKKRESRELSWNDNDEWNFFLGKLVESNQFPSSDILKKNT